MKLRPAHEKALRATLRVTLFAALGACGGGGTAARPDAPANTPTPGETAKASPTTEDECRAALKAAYPAGDDKWFSPDEKTARTPTEVSDADLAACCDKLTANTEEYRVLGCCSAKWEGAQCTPWGPPMPPAMRASA